MFSRGLCLEERYARASLLVCCLWEISTNPLVEDVLDSCILLCAWSKLLSDHAGSEETVFLCSCCTCALSAPSAAGFGLSFYLQKKRGKKKKENKRGKEGREQKE